VFRVEKERCKTLEWDEWNVMTWDRLLQGLAAVVVSISVDLYSHAQHNDVSVNDGPHTRRWSHNVTVNTTVLQLPTVFSTVTCCTVCSVGAIGYTV
jgi:hypothetical protein